MQNKKSKHIGLTINPELHSKIKYISEYYGRSMNREFIYLIRCRIKKYEQTHGKIEYNAENE